MAKLASPPPVVKSHTQISSKRRSTSTLKAPQPVKASDVIGDLDGAPNASELELDNASGKPVSGRLYRKYFRSGGSNFFWTITISLNFLAQGFAIFSDSMLAKWCNAEAGMYSTPGDFSRIQYVILYGSAVVIAAITFCARTFLISAACLRSSAKLHDQMYTGLRTAKQAFFDANPVGKILGRCSRDQDSVDKDMPGVIQDIATCSAVVVATLIMIAALSYITIPFILLLLFAYYKTQAYYRPASRVLKRLESSARNPIYGHFGETVNGLITVRAFHREEYYREILMRRTDRNVRYYYCGFGVNRWLGVRLEMIGALLVLLACVGVLSWDFLSAAGYITSPTTGAGWAGLAITTTLSISGNLNWYAHELYRRGNSRRLVRQVSELEVQMNAVEKIVEYVDLPAEEAQEQTGKTPRQLENAAKVNPNLSGSRVPANTPAHAEGWPSHGAVDAVKLFVRYTSSLPLVLKGITFQIPAGAKVGIVGRTGSGKSSLTMTLFRVINPQYGVEGSDSHFRIDGVDIMDLALQQLRSSIAIIPQEPVLFSGTVRWNLDPYGKTSDSELWEGTLRFLTDILMHGSPRQSAAERAGQTLLC